MTRAEMEEEVKSLMNEITDSNLYCVVEEVLEETKDLFYTYPAATRNHHNFVGGLAYHSISMVLDWMFVDNIHSWIKVC